MQTQMATKPAYEELVAQNAALSAQIVYLKSELAQLRRLIFGQKRERYVPATDDQLALDILAPESQPKPPATEEIRYTRRKQKPKVTPHSRNPLPAHLPRKEIVIDPDEDTAGCKKIGEEITEELEYKPGKLYVNRYIRPKYARPNDRGIAIAALPTRPIEKGIAGPGLLAHILISKYVDHLPLYRQAKQFRREGIELAESTLGGWVAASYELLQPLGGLLREQVFSADYLMVDETPIRVLDRAVPKNSRTGYYWPYYDPVARLVSFDYRPSRSRAGPNERLKNFSGYLQTDGYTGYDEVTARKEVVAVACLAHARRYFVEARENDPERAEWMLKAIQKLYQIERLAREAEMSFDARYRLRQKSAPPILAEIETWLKQAAREVLPKSAIGKAVGYMQKRWAALQVYLTDGRLEIDNNLVENAIRPVALGRKNYLFAGSHAGAKRAALIYSLVNSAALHNKEPFHYLRDVISRIAEHPHKKLAELLPNNWQE